MGLFSFFLLVFGVIILSALISGSEAAILSVSYTKAREIYEKSSGKKQKRAKKLVLVKENIRDYITTIVILNNLVNILGSVYVGVLSSKIFGSVYLGLVSTIMTFLIIMFSEIIPKVYGQLYSERISLTIISILVFLTRILFPIISLLNKISSLFVKSKHLNSVSEGEIKEMAKLGEKEGTIDTYESDVINNVFKMNDTEVYDVMVPKSKMKSVRENYSFKKIVKLSQETGFTRFPVLKKDEIIGLITVKDLFKYYDKEEKFKVSKVIRPIFFVPENMKLVNLEQKFKIEKTHMASVVNEHGDLTGIVTFEDIIEELIGEIEDEFDEDESSKIKKISNKKYNILSGIDFMELVERFNLNILIDENVDFTTLNGFLVEKLGKIPRVNNKVYFNNGVFRVIKASKKKSLEVEMSLK